MTLALAGSQCRALFIELIVKVPVKFKTTSIWMENRLLLLGSELHSMTLFLHFLLYLPPVSFYPLTSSFLPLLLRPPLPPPSMHRLCFVKIANTCFRKGYFNMAGYTASGWDACWASLDSWCSLGCSASHWSVLYLYINMTVGRPHQEASAFCLFTSSTRPSVPLHRGFRSSVCTFIWNILRDGVHRVNSK